MVDPSRRRRHARGATTICGATTPLRATWAAERTSAVGGGPSLLLRTLGRMSSSRTPGGAGGPDTRSTRGWGDAARRFVELLAFCGVAIAQPVLDSFGRSPEHFVFRGAGSTEIVVFAVVVALGPPALLFVATRGITRISEQVGRLAHVAVLSVLGGLAGVQLGWRTFDLTSIPLAAFALMVAGVVGALYLRVPPFRLWTRYLVVLPVAAVVSFLLFSPAADLVWSRSVDAASVDLAEAPPIVVLIFDELPTATLIGDDGSIDAELYPNFARLGEVSTWYRNNSTNSNNTTLAVPALLTGQIPEELGATLANHPQNLFTLLGGTYDIRADEAPLQLCPENLCTAVSGSGGSLRQLLGDARRLWFDQVSINDPGSKVFDLIEETVAVEGGDAPESPTPAEEIAEAFREGERLMTTSPTRQAAFLDAIRPSTTPRLHYLHLQLPHGPFRFFPNGAEYERPDSGLDTFTRYELRIDSEVPARVDRQRHILQTQFADALLGQLLDRLEGQNLLDESVLIVTSDHGITFNPGVTPRLGTEVPLPPDSVDDVFWVPLFMKSPGQGAGGVSDAPTELIDVLPTLMEWLGADPGWELDGLPIDSLGTRDERTLCRPIAEGDSTPEVQCVDMAGSDVLAELLGSGVGDFLLPGDPSLRVYRAGPFGSLVGRPLDELTVGEASPQEAELRGIDGLSDVDTDGLLPGLVTGSLLSGDDGVALAFSLNGTIAAVTETFTKGDAHGQINAMLPYSLLVAGDNALEVYVVDGSAATSTLRRAAVSAG